MERLHRFVFIHRRSLAAIAAGAAVFFSLGAVESDGVRVTVAARDLPSGHIIRSDDLETVRFARDSVPESAQPAGRLTGRSLAGPVRAGEVLTDRRVLDPTNLDGYGIGDPVMMSLRIADPTAVAGLRAGDRVDIVAFDHESAPAVVTRDVVVAAVRTAEDEAATISVVASSNTALEIAAANANRSLTVLTSPARQP